MNGLNRMMQNETKQPLSQQRLQRAEQLRNHNLAFFAEAYPRLYEVLSSHQVDNVKLTFAGVRELDCIIDGKSGYHGKANAIAEAEAAEFLERVTPSQTYQSVAPIFAENYSNPRVFSRGMTTLLEASPWKREDYHGSYVVPEIIPLMVFTGIGLGLQISKILLTQKTRTVIIYEPKIEKMLVSLFCVDWRAIVASVTSQSHGSVKFLLNDKEDPSDRWKVLWNELIVYFPKFPLSCFFHNHLADQQNAAIIKNLFDNIPLLMYGLGNFDDELNQLNNAMHNLNLGKTVALLGQQETVVESETETDAESESVICIVGSARSLDDYIDVLKQHRGKVIVASCGSSITALFQHGIRPDIHFMLESDAVIDAEILAAIDDDTLKKKMPVVIPLQMNPLLVKQFENQLLFLKEEGVVANMLSDQNRLTGAGPTCTNEATAFALATGFDKIMLMGMDFGFAHPDDHHSEKSIYYSKDQTDYLKQSASIDSDQIIPVTNQFDEPYYTRPYYYTAWMSLNRCLSASDSEATVYNCSKGMPIERTTYLDESDFNQTMEQAMLVDAQAAILGVFNVHEKDRDLNFESAKAFVKNLSTEMRSYITMLKGYLDRQLSRSAWEVLDELSTEFNHELMKEQPVLHALIGGSMNQYLYGVMGQYLIGACQAEYQSHWMSGLIKLLNQCVDVFERELFKEFNLETDASLHLTIKQSLE